MTISKEEVEYYKKYLPDYTDNEIEAMIKESHFQAALAEYEMKLGL